MLRVFNQNLFSINDQNDQYDNTVVRGRNIPTIDFLNARSHYALIDSAAQAISFHFRLLCR
jgi:hypothetical protein